jgi:hypothetical protein
MTETTDRLVYRVTAIGSTDAQDKAKAACRAEGHRIRTTCSVRAVEDRGDIPYDQWRREPHVFDVTIAVKAP